MPAKSEKQQTAARIALAVKKGKVKAKPGSASAQMAKGMSKEKIKHFTKMENDAGTTSVNVGGGPPTVPPGKKSKLPPEFLKHIKKKKEAEKEKKEEAAAFNRVMRMVYEEEARSGEKEEEHKKCAGCDKLIFADQGRFCHECERKRNKERAAASHRPVRGYWNKEKWYPRR